MPRNWIDVISAGPGAKEGMTLQAREALARADAVFCAARNAPLVPEEKRRPLLPLNDALNEIAACENAAVLVSGDAGLYSLLGALSRRFGRERLRVIPGVSSLQALCAKLSLPWQEVKILSLHGRECSPEALCHAARVNRLVFLLLDGERDPNWVHDVLEAGGLSEVSLTVGERLSYPDERVAPYERRPYNPLSVAMIENPAPKGGLPPIGLRDDAFIRGKTPMTKREIRVQVLSSLRLPPDAVAWDIGAGTGSVTVEMARQCPLGRVYAIERDAEALELIGRNVREFHLQNVEIIAGEAPEALRGLPVPTHVFLGGTGGETKSILRLLEDLHASIRLCATAVTLESASLLTEALSAYEDFTACQLAVSRLEQVGAYRMFRAQNPVFVFSAETGGTT